MSTLRETRRYRPVPAKRGATSSSGRRTPTRAPSEKHATVPVFRELSRAECVRILKRNHVGRLAFAHRNRVDIEPVHYVFAEDWLHGRTAPGTKISVLRRQPWVAVEVDEVEGLFDWRSVVMHGSVYILDPNRSANDREVFARTLTHVRKLVPSALDADDPTPQRTVLFRIHVDSLTGRASSTRRDR